VGLALYLLSFSALTLLVGSPDPSYECICTLKAILKGDEEVKAWLDYESVPLDEVLVFLATRTKSSKTNFSY